MCLPTFPFKTLGEWTHVGLLCTVVQAQQGRHLCGYVRVPPGHPLHGLEAYQIDAWAPGAVNFAKIEPCEHEDGQGWWFGFDCGHSWDDSLEPGFDPSVLPPDERFLWDYEVRISKIYDGSPLGQRVYWTEPMVREATEFLAEQLAAVPV